MSIGPALVDRSFTLVRGESLRISLHAYEIKLRTAFGTSHSSSTSRLNGLIRLQLTPNCMYNAAQTAGVDVYAEVGLPPKKAFVYEADMADIQVFVDAYCTCLAAATTAASGVNMSGSTSAELAGLTASVEQVLQNTPTFSFPSLRTPIAAMSDSEIAAVDVFCTLLGALDACPLQAESFARAASSMIEVAATALLAEMKGISVSRLLLGDLSITPSKHCSFYTAALNDEVHEMVQSAVFGAQHTPHLKVKLDGDPSRCAAILAALADWSSDRGSSNSNSNSSNSNSNLLEEEEGKEWWSLDANCAWSATLVAALCQDLLPRHSHRIKMIEQPFPVNLVFQAAQAQGTGAQNADVAAELKQWVDAKDAVNRLGIDVYADESMRTYLDIAVLAPFVNGVNIKMEKAGGYRAALRAVACAHEAGLKVWFGCMVGSNLNSTQAAALAPLADGGSDLDGSLLVTEESKAFTGGFQFGPNGSIVLEALPGLGVRPKEHVRM